MQVYTLIIDTYNKGVQVELFKTKKQALESIKEWNFENEVIKEVKTNGYFHSEDDKRPFTVVLEKKEVG